MNSHRTKKPKVWSKCPPGESEAELQLRSAPKQPKLQDVHICATLGNVDNCWELKVV